MMRHPGTNSIRMVAIILFTVLFSPLAFSQAEFGMGGPSASPPPASDRSAVEVQALIYSDTVSVTRIDTRKINFPELNNFVEDFLHKAIGSVESEDTYLVKLRERQKDDLKESVLSYLTKLQKEGIEGALWANGVGEYYLIRYEKWSDFCNIIAYPTTGLGDQQKEALIAKAGKDYNPICCFERFNFLIVVTGHSESFGSGGWGSTENDEAVDVDPIKEKRKQTLPAIRKRFINPSIEKCENVTEAFIASQGAAITQVYRNTDSFTNAIMLCRSNGLDIPDTGIQNTLEKHRDSYSWSTGNVMLMGTPRLVLLMKFKVPAAATEMEETLKSAINGMQSGVNGALDAQVKSLGLPFTINPFGGMLDLIFKGFKLSTKETETALEFDLDLFRQHANLFIPIFGGVPSKAAPKKKSGVKGESEEEIDWGTEEVKRTVIKKEEAPAPKATPKEEPNNTAPANTTQPAATETTTPPANDKPKAENEDPFA